MDDENMKPPILRYSIFFYKCNYIIYFNIFIPIKLQKLIRKNR